MPRFTHYTQHELHRALRSIFDAVYTPVAPLAIVAWRTPEPVPFSARRSGERLQLRPGDKWGDLFDCAWFRFSGRVPSAAAGRKVVLLLDVNGEMAVVDTRGNPILGLTAMASGFDSSLGAPGKRVVRVSDRARGGERIDLWAEAGCNDLFGNLQGNGAVKEASIAVCDEELRGLYYDFEVLLDLMKVLPEDSARHQQILTALSDAAHALREHTTAETREARRLLAPMLRQRGGDPSLMVSAVGHSHIDLGWLWPIRETIRKGGRTFSTVLDLMERYPEYVFGASQPQLYQWMKQRYPALYARVRQRVKEGRFEPQGVMWVEADTNLAGGEALVRQILQGKRFFRREFGREVNHLWLPDVFGYNAALPQLLRKSGADIFLTQKMSWSLINRFPHHSFHWQGIDGSTVLAHLPPEDTYNSSAAPRSLAKIEKNYRDKDVSNRSILLFGIGDGGGGPGEEHLERLRRIRNLAGLCPVAQEPAAAFFEKWRKAADRLPTWVGELYLERHQGTLTTQARNKWFNRRMELALRELEWTGVLAQAVAHASYPAQRLTDIWQEMLLYQFHDILPGSSIKRVYDESRARYRTLLDEVQERIDGNLRRVARRIDARGMSRPLAAFNSLSWERTEWIRAGRKWRRVTVPSMGHAVVDAAGAGEKPPALAASSRLLENDVLRVRFDAGGAIVSVFDKQAGRETIAGAQRANRLAVYADLGDAWDFPMAYAERRPRHLSQVEAEARVEGPRAILKQTYRIGHSELVQEVVLTAGSRRLDFNTRLRWRETRTMLRTSFPVAVLAEEATFEIQYGHVRRPTHQNTTWDLAKDEVPAHKWVDLSQGDCGVALLNDSKYGHRVKGNVIDLNLLRSVPYPGPQRVRDADVRPGQPHDGYTDQSDHVFSYALYPHAGDHAAGRVAQAAYEFNVPLRVVPLRPGAGSLPASASFITVGAPNVIVEAVKKAEDGRGVIVRLYEIERRATRTSVTFGLPVAEAAETDLMEEHPVPLRLKGRSVTISFGPFEIKTLRVMPPAK